MDVYYGTQMGVVVFIAGRYGEQDRSFFLLKVEVLME